MGQDNFTHINNLPSSYEEYGIISQFYVLGI